MGSALSSHHSSWECYRWQLKPNEHVILAWKTVSCAKCSKQFMQIAKTGLYNQAGWYSTYCGWENEAPYSDVFNVLLWARWFDEICILQEMGHWRLMCLDVLPRNQMVSCVFVWHSSLPRNLSPCLYHGVLYEFFSGYHNAIKTWSFPWLQIQPLPHNLQLQFWFHSKQLSAKQNIFLTCLSRNTSSLWWFL